MTSQRFPKGRPQDADGKNTTVREVVSRPPVLLRRACVVAAAILLLVPVLYAQTATVFGTITYRNQQPVAHALVSIGGVYRYTDGGGRYKLEGVPQGQQHMMIRSGQRILWQGDVMIRGAVAELNRDVP